MKVRFKFIELLDGRVDFSLRGEGFRVEAGRFGRDLEDARKIAARIFKKLNLEVDWGQLQQARFI